MSGNASVESRAATWLTLAGIALLAIATLLLYRDTAVRLVALWGEDETFAHGYMVPLIVVWLMWRKRKDVAALAPMFAPAPSALLCVAAAGALWLVGEAATINPASQFALVALLVLIVPVLAGWPAMRVVFFPLTFLFFAVPFGEFLLPWLMDWTADFTVLALRATGVPVYRDGLQFVIPSGSWSVIKACSGVRYLLASLMVGALFAYLNYRSTRRRVLFMLVAIAVPVVANWVRAYLIVMIGHLSSNTLAVGVDHLIYGWLFFGVVVGVMFMIGARWSEAPAESGVAAASASGAGGHSDARRLWAAAATMLVLLALPLAVLRGLTAHEDHSAPQLALPALVGTPAATDDDLPAWTPAFANPAATIARVYPMKDQFVGLYIAYYRGQGPGRKLVSSSNALVKSTDTAWTVADEGALQVAVGERGIAVKTARLRRPISSSDPTRLRVWRTYWVNGRLEAADARAKAWGAWQRLLGGGDDGAVLVVYAQEQPGRNADSLLAAFLREHLADIETQLRKTRDGD